MTNVMLLDPQASLLLQGSSRGLYGAGAGPQSGECCGNPPAPPSPDLPSGATSGSAGLFKSKRISPSFHI